MDQDAPLPPEVEAFERFLHHEGMRLTPERRTVAEAVFSDEEHFGVEGLQSRLAQRGDRVSRATLYRTLDLLVRSGLVLKARLGQDSYLYEHLYGRSHHGHLSCLACGKIIEFTCDEFHDLQEEVCRQLAFKAVRHTLHISGFCSDCRDAFPEG